MSQYSISVPDDDSVPTQVQTFLERFYHISDQVGGHNEYAGMFTPDATLIIGFSSVTGTEGIVRMRQTMWEKVAKRSHHPEKIFAFGPSGDEFMLYGLVDYNLKDGRSATAQWAARAKFASLTGDVKMSFYQVYLTQDTAPPSAAK